MEQLWFVLSKLFWSVAEPATTLLAIWLAGSVLLFTPWFRLGRALVALSCLITFANAMLPLGQWALKPLEDRFPPLITLPPQVDGIIVLGGVIDDFVIGKRGVPRSLSAAGSPRLDAFLELSRRYPAARHIFTGGSIDLINDRDTEADVVRRIFARLGVDTTRILFEDRSRNTWENARFTFERVHPEPEQTWIIITSARHMPRAIGVFRTVGWRNLIAFPVDFTTDEETRFRAEFRLGANLQYLSEAIREYVGLVAYYYLGRTSELLPGS